MIIEFSVFTLILYGILGAVLYRFIPAKWRALYLTLISLCIYTMWTGLGVVLLILEILIGWSAVSLLGSQKCRFTRGVLAVSVTIIVGILLAHKYALGNRLFFSDNDAASLIIPLGLSYYSFKIISSIVDAYKGKISKISFFEYTTYVSIFTQIVSGPISRADEFEIRDDKNSIDITEATSRIIRGLFYKYVIAERLSVYTLTVMRNYSSYNSLALIMAMFFYSIQLYADFAGYSDIAIGLCELYGFKVRDNFRLPYFSKSIKEFWTRWHISLSSWLKDYIYIPLGGNRKGKIRQKINIIIVFLISGIWHGSTMTYILWGIWHGIWNLLSPRTWRNKCSVVVSTVMTYIIVALGWLCFSLDTIADVWHYIIRMFSQWSISMDAIVTAVMPFSGDYSCVAKFIVIVGLIIVTAILEWREYSGRKVNVFIRSMMYMSALILFGVFGAGSFIYANY